MTSTDLELHQPRAAALSEPPSALAKLMDQVQAMKYAHELATAMCGTNVVPFRYRGKPDDGAAAILYGAELGLNAIQSLQRVVNINGTPGIETRTMIALLKAKGYRFKTVSQTDKRVVVVGWAPNGDEEQGDWTIERATKAGYVPQIDPKTDKFAVNDKGKIIGNEKYLSDPQGMLYAKAGAEVCRKLAPEVLLGIDVIDGEVEIIDEPPLPVQAQAARIASRTEALRARLGIDAPATLAIAATEEPPSKKGAKPEPAQVDEQQAGGPITPDQLKRLAVLLKRAKMVDPQNSLAWMSSVVKHDDVLPSSKALTEAEAETVFVELEKLITPQVADGGVR